MAKTRAQIINQALVNCSVISAGNTAAPEDSALMGVIYDARHSALVDDKIAYWSSASVPDKLFLNISMDLAAMAVHAFQLPATLRSELVTLGRRAEQKLRDAANRQTKEVPVKADYF